QVSQPSRCNGNSAAVLPTLPQATQDCTESTVGISRRARIYAVKHTLDVEEDERAADDEQAEPRSMHRAALPRMGDEQPGQPDDREQRDHEGEVLHVVDEQKGAPA